MTNNSSISKNTLVNLGLVLTVAAGIFYYAISNEKRLSMIEASLSNHLSDPGLHHGKMTELERKIDANGQLIKNELLIQFQALEKRLDRMEDKLN